MLACTFDKSAPAINALLGQLDPKFAIQIFFLKSKPSDECPADKFGCAFGVTLKVNVVIRTVVMWNKEFVAAMGCKREDGIIAGLSIPTRSFRYLHFKAINTV